MGKHEIRTSHNVELTTGDVAYIKLPEFKEDAKVKRTISLRDLVQDFKGTDVEFDFSEDGTLLGIEILAF